MLLPFALLTSLMFVRSKLFLSGALAGCALLIAVDAHSQTRVKIGNPFESEFSVKSVVVESKDWRATQLHPGTTKLLKHDSLDLEFTSIAGVDEIVTVTLVGDVDDIVWKQLLSAPTASVETNINAHQLFVSPVWPNPAKENLSFNVHGLRMRNLQAFIYDLQGKEILAQTIDREGAITLILPSMPEGRYYFMLRDGMETLAMQEIKISGS